MKEDGAFLARKLIYTEQGKRWLRQFDDLDQEIAIQFANSLTLISHTEFRRKLEQNLEEAARDVEGPVALFAIRELPKSAPEQWMTPQPMPFFGCTVASPDGRSVSAVDATSDLGSEAIVAQIIRQLARSDPTKFLNHPHARRNERPALQGDLPCR